MKARGSEMGGRNFLSRGSRAACRMRSAALLALLLAFAAGCRSSDSAPPRASYPALESSSFGTMRNVSVADQIWFGGSPGEGDLELAQRRGVHAVIDLSSPEEVCPIDVAAVCGALGLAYEKPVIASSDPLDDELVDQVLELLEREDGEPILMFCGSGSRCATLLAIHRASRIGVPLEEALIEARRAGMRPQDELFVREQVQRLAGGPPSEPHPSRP